MNSFYEDQRFGSASWATNADTVALRRARGLYLGLDAANGRILRHPGDGPALMIAGSGAGKAVSGGLMYNACTYPGAMLVVNIKGEIDAVSMVAQAALGKHAYSVNPARLLGAAHHSCDPLDILKAGSPTLVADCKMIAEMLVPLSGSSNGEYFEKKSRLLIEALKLADIEQNGRTGLRSLYRLVNAIEGDPDFWIPFGERMFASSYEHVRRVAAELAMKLRDAPKEAGAILGETTKTLSFADDPAFLADIENPAFSMSVLCERPCTVFITIPSEYLGIWSPYLRLLIGVAMLYKQRRPDAPRVVYMIDEAGQLGRADFLLRAMTFGRGAGIICQAVFQDLGQIAKLYGREGVQTFIASSQVRQFFGVRDYETAELVSRMLGTQTLDYDSELEQTAARRSQGQLVRELMNGADPFETGLSYAQQARAAVHRTKMARPLLDPSEIIRLPEYRQILFVSGVNCPPIAAYRKPYFASRELAGRFMPNPYHPPVDRVRVPGIFGARWRRVVTERVPQRFADFPQYQSGFWSYIEGYRP